MTLTLWFAESEVSSVVATQNSLCVRLSAASVESAATPGLNEAVVGYASGVLLRLPDFRVREKSEPTFGRIRAGVLRVQEQCKRSCTLPVECNTPVEFELTFANGASLLVSAAAFSAAFEGKPNFHESLAC